MKDKSEKYQVSFVASGRVQGVCFRYFVQTEAVKKNITGWVKNLSSGDVEGIMQGTCLSLENMIEKIKTGTSLARVLHVNVNWEPVVREYKSFDIHY